VHAALTCARGITGAAGGGVGVGDQFVDLGGPGAHVFDQPTEVLEEGVRVLDQAQHAAAVAGFEGLLKNGEKSDGGRDGKRHGAQFAKDLLPLVESNATLVGTNIVSLAVLQHPNNSRKICRCTKLSLLSRDRKTRHLKKHGKQEPLCAIFLDEYALMTNAQQFAFEKAIEAEQRWSTLSLDVCHVCDGCHLTKMCRTTVDFGHTTKREYTPICGSCAHNPARNTAQNWVIPYWLDKHGTIHTNVPGELHDLTFAEKQLIALDSSHMSLIHLKNGTLVSRGHCVSVEQIKKEFFTTRPRKPGDLNLFNVRRSGRSSDNEVYERVLKVLKDTIY
jgi:hypothetical protein